MDLATLESRHGGNVVLCGTISTQRTLPFGTSHDVACEAQHALEILAPGGGFVVKPIHPILPDVQIENALALHRTALAFRY